MIDDSVGGAPSDNGAGYLVTTQHGATLCMAAYDGIRLGAMRPHVDRRNHRQRYWTL